MRVAFTGLALSTAVRVIDRIHSDAPYVGTPASVSLPPRLAYGYELVLGVPYLAYRGHALDAHEPYLARGQF